MGTMAVNSSRLGTTPYATTVVFTATLATLFSDPLLPFSLGQASKTRATTVIALVVGGAASQAIGILATRNLNPDYLMSLKLVAPIGSAFGIGLAALADLLSAVLWMRTSKSEE
jgi:hypothetical protein